MMGPVKGKLHIWLQIPQSSWLLALQIRYLLWFPKQGMYIYSMCSNYMYLQYMYITNTVYLQPICPLF